MNKNCGDLIVDCGKISLPRRRFLSIRNPRSTIRNLLLFCAVVTAIWLAVPKPPLLEGVAFSQCVRDRNGKLLRVTLTADQKFRVWTSLPNISLALIDATLQFEDKYYRHHPGINPVALVRSAFNLRPSGAHSGASTITMQVARLRYHLATRTLSGKFVQIIRALELERHYSKDEILEAYLNLAPYGRNIEGVGAASQLYFGKTAAHLTKPESISLSVIPQSPTRRALFVDRDNRSLDAAQSSWYDRAKIDRQFSARLFSARAQTERKFLAPHFVQQVVATEKGRDEIVTTLDLSKQQLIERRIADYIRTNRGRGIQNVAALLIDTRSMDVLARSRNLPAVELAAQLRHPTLYEFLRGAGVKLPRAESLYGLALPLGGAEVTMEDLVRLYAALANNGELRPLRRTSRDPLASRGRSVISLEAAFLTLEMLNQPRPEISPAYSDQAAPVFWKTGTSHGFHDAWSIAVFNHYVLAIWIGNFDGRANGAFVGRTAAAPLLFQIIDSLRTTWPEPNEPHLPPPGANLKRVSFCAVSGDLPGEHCTQQLEGWFIPGISPIKQCDVHQEVLVDAASGLRVARDDGTRQLRHEIY